MSESSSGAASNSSSDDVAVSEGSDGHLIILFLLVSLAVGVITRHLFQRFRLPLPYTVVLLVIGVLLGLLTQVDSANDLIAAELIYSNMNPNIVLYVFLPALIFESAYNVHFRVLWRLLVPALLLAGPGAVIFTLVTAALSKFAFDYGFDWNQSLLFGAMLSATDTVAVVSLLREVGASKRLATLIEDASGLESDTSAGSANSITGAAEVVKFIRIAFGGPLWGFVIGWITEQWLNQIYNSIEVEITTTILSAYVCFFVAEQYLGVSAPLALMMLGLWLSRRKSSISPEVQTSLHDVWLIISYIANTVIFVFAGVIVAQRLFIDSSIRGVDFALLLMLYVVQHFIRALAVIILTPLMRLAGYKLDAPNGFMLVWSSIRGALSLVLGLLTSLQTQIDPLVRDRMMFQISGVVLLTLIINGTTSPWIVSVLGLNKGTSESRAILAQAVVHMRDRTGRKLFAMKNDPAFRQANWKTVRRYLPRRLLQSAQLASMREQSSQHSRTFGTFTNRSSVIEPFDHASNDAHRTQLREEIITRFLSANISEYERLFAKGLITRPALHILVDAAGRALDKASLSVQWEMVSKRMDVPYILSAAYQTTALMNVSFARRLIESAMFNHFTLSIELSIALLKGKERIEDLCNSFPEFESVDAAIVNEVRAEAGVYQRKAFSSYANVRRSYPEAYESVQSRHATMTLLQYERDTVDQLANTGMLEEAEYDQIQRLIEEKLFWLTRSQPRAIIPSAQETLLTIDYIRHLNAHRKIQLLQQSKRTLFKSGVDLVSKGQRMNGVYIIVRGLVALFFDRWVDEPEGDEETEQPPTADALQEKASDATSNALSALPVNLSVANTLTSSNAPITSALRGSADAPSRPIKKLRLSVDEGKQRIHQADVSAFLQRLTVPSAESGSLSSSNITLRRPPDHQPVDATILYAHRIDDDALQPTRRGHKVTITEKYGSGSAVGIYSTLTGRESISSATTLTTVEAFFFPAETFRLLMSDPISSECMWRLEADTLLKARFLSVLEIRAIYFEHVTTLVAHSQFGFEPGEYAMAQYDDMTRHLPLIAHRDSRLLLIKGEVDISAVTPPTQRTASAAPSTQAFAPCLLQYFAGDVELRFASGSTWIIWTEATENRVTGLSIHPPMTPAEEARLHGISIALGVTANVSVPARAAQVASSAAKQSMTPSSPRANQLRDHRPQVVARDRMPWNELHDDLTTASRGKKYSIDLTAKQSRDNKDDGDDDADDDDDDEQTMTVADDAAQTVPMPPLSIVVDSPRRRRSSADRIRRTQLTADAQTHSAADIELILLPSAQPIVTEEKLRDADDVPTMATSDVEAVDAVTIDDAIRNTNESTAESQQQTVNEQI